MTDVSASMSHEISQAVSEALNGAGNTNDVDVEEICSNIVEQFSDKIENMVDEITMAVEGMTGAFEEMRDSLDDISEN